MPIQQTTTDMHSAPQKLSKIETLRLAKNYILAMSQTLSEGKPMALSRFIRILSKELSQTTANLLTGTLMGLGSGMSMDYQKIYYGNHTNGSIPYYSCMTDLQNNNYEKRSELNEYFYGSDYPLYYRSSVDSVITHTDTRKFIENSTATDSVKLSNSCLYDNYQTKPFHSI